MPIVLALLLLIIGTVLLLWGADWFIDGIRDLSRVWGISALVLGIILAGLEPEEMITAALASAQGAGHLALGNAIGTNVTLVTLALGLAAWLTPVIIQRQVRTQAIIATLASIPPIIFMIFGWLNRITGLLLLILFAGYNYLLVRTDRQTIANLASADDDDDDDERDEITDHLTLKKQPVWQIQLQQKNWYQRWKPALCVSGGLLAMAIGGPAIVTGALQLAEGLGLKQEIIGATIVALGTGAEIVALAIVAARKQRMDILVGSIIGSFAYNLLITIGLAALINPLPPLSSSLVFPLIVMIAAHLLFLYFIWRGKIARRTGTFLLSLYIIYLLVTIVTGALFFS